MFSWAILNLYSQTGDGNNASIDHAENSELYRPDEYIFYPSFSVLAFLSHSKFLSFSSFMTVPHALWFLLFFPELCLVFPSVPANEMSSTHHRIAGMLIMEIWHRSQWQFHARASEEIIWPQESLQLDMGGTHLIPACIFNYSKVRVIKNEVLVSLLCCYTGIFEMLE